MLYSRRGKSEWHRLWQDRVSGHQCEITVRDDFGKYHRADICHEKTVFEIQHSQISEEDISQRQNFYSHHGYHLIWIVDATTLSYFPFGKCFLIDLPSWIIPMQNVWLDVGYGFLQILEIRNFKRQYYGLCNYKTYSQFEETTHFPFTKSESWWNQPYSPYQQSIFMVRQYTEDWMMKHPKQISEARTLLDRLQTIDAQFHSHFLWKTIWDEVAVVFTDWADWNFQKWCRLFHIKRKKVYKNMNHFVDWMIEYPMERCTQIYPRMWYCGCPCEERTFLLVFLLHQSNTEDILQRQHRHKIPSDFCIPMNEFVELNDLLPMSYQCSQHSILNFETWWQSPRQIHFLKTESGYYYQNDYELQTSIMNWIERHSKVSKTMDASRLKYLWDGLLIERPMDPDQVKLMNYFVENNLMCLTGKPGTGKTASITGLLYCLYKAGISFIVSSFTGKALYRLKDAILTTLKSFSMAKTDYQKFQDYIDMHTFTLHRIKTGTIECIPKTQVLIVDETSMVSGKLFYKAILQFTNVSRVILSGDPNQLEPIGRGRVFDWILDKYPTLELTHCHRQKGTSILTSASNLLNGHIELETDEYFEYLHHNPIESVIQWSKSHPDGIVLSYTNQVVDKVNDDLIEYHSKGLYDTIQFQKFFVGMKVIHTRKNIYDYKETSSSSILSIMNGEEGIIHKIHKDHLKVKYPTKIITYDFDEATNKHHPHIEYLKPAYAITIHKSQGSEWNNVYVYLTFVPEKIGNRLVYTALTRAKTKCILNCPSYALNNLKK